MDDRSIMAAKKFVFLLERGIIKRDFLSSANTTEDYDIAQMDIDLTRYKRFLQSFAYDDIKDCSVGNYLENGD